MGKKFLISNDPDKIKWVMEKEQKMIGNYLCFKATAQVSKPKTMTSVWRNAEKTNDISADLYSLSENTNYVICSGAKSILDLDKTYELLETLGITRIVSQCSRNLSSPHSAFCFRRFPSELNG